MKIGIIKNIPLNADIFLKRTLKFTSMQQIAKRKFAPESFVLQWHITEHCNWRCKHCYQESYETPELNIQKMEDVIVQFVALIKKWKLSKERAVMHITGGEPFIRKDFFILLNLIKKYSGCFQWVITSNGSLLTEDIAKKLKALGISAFQVSLEGAEKVNDEIRGKGSFQKVLGAIKLLNQANIPTRVSLTLSKKNFQEIKELARLLAPLNVFHLGVRRIAPFGSGGNQLKNLVLEPQELRSTYQEMEKINRELIEKNCTLRVVGGCENAIFNDEISSPYLMSHGKCGVNGGEILVVMPNGDVLICRRFPIKIGNILEKSLKEIYYSPIYENFRSKKSDVPFECYACSNLKSCQGGAKCVTYALTGKTAPDVQCWKLFGNLDESVSYIKRQYWFKKILLFLRVFRSSNG